MSRQPIAHQPALRDDSPDGERPYSYAEDVNEAPAVVAAEPVDVETAAAAVPNMPVERLPPEDREIVVSVEG